MGNDWECNPDLGMFHGTGRNQAIIMISNGNNHASSLALLTCVCVMRCVLPRDEYTEMVKKKHRHGPDGSGK